LHARTAKQEAVANRKGDLLPFSKPRELDDTPNSFILEIMEHEVFSRGCPPTRAAPTPAVIGRPAAKGSLQQLARGH
jgi:hypothetical protein